MTRLSPRVCALLSLCALLAACGGDDAPAPTEDATPADVSEDIAAPEVRFGAGGLAPLLEEPGLGVSVVQERVENLATFQEALI